MRSLVMLLCTICAAIPAGLAQAPSAAGQPSPVELDGTRQQATLLTPREAIRAADDPLPAGLTARERASRSGDRITNGMVNVRLSVIIDQSGHVESARPTTGPERLYPQAVELELRRVFEPVHDQNGIAVRAHFIDYVSVYPPEKWLKHAPAFPAQVDLGTFRVALERTGCLGTCPSYKVTVSGSGDVLWQGSPFLAVPGTHHAQISRQAVQELIEQVRASRILSALDQYDAGWTDNPTYTITLDVNGLHKQVVDYIGLIVGMPTSVHELEETIDRIAGTEKWIKGDAACMQSPRTPAATPAIEGGRRESISLQPAGSHSIAVSTNSMPPRIWGRPRSRTNRCKPSVVPRRI